MGIKVAEIEKDMALGRLLEPGVHKVKVSRIDETLSRKGDPMLKVTVKSIKNNKERYVYFTYNENSLFSFVNAVASAGYKLHAEMDLTLGKMISFLMTDGLEFDFKLWYVEKTIGFDPLTGEKITKKNFSHKFIPRNNCDLKLIKELKDFHEK